MDDNQDIPQIKPQGKSPVDSAANKLREAISKEHQAKIDAQMKVTVEAAKVFAKEKSKLQALVEEADDDKTSLSELLKGLL